MFLLIVRILKLAPLPMPTLKHWMRYDALGETLFAEWLSRLNGRKNLWGFCQARKVVTHLSIPKKRGVERANYR